MRGPDTTPVARRLFIYELKAAHGGKTVLVHEVNNQATSGVRAARSVANSSDCVFNRSEL